MKKKPSINVLPIPLFCNTPENKMSISLSVFCDVCNRRVDLFEHKGMYWFSLKDANFVCNSRGFVSLRNCVSAIKGTLSSLGMVLCDSNSLDNFVNRWEHSIRYSSVKRSNFRVPSTWRV